MFPLFLKGCIVSTSTPRIIYPEDDDDPNLIFDLFTPSTEPGVPDKLVSFHVLKERHASANKSVDNPDVKVEVSAG